MEEQRSQRGCVAGRMQLEFHHGLLGPVTIERKGREGRKEEQFVDYSEQAPQR